MTATHFVAEIDTTESNPTEQRIDELMDAIADYHGALGITPEGRLTLLLTFPADRLVQATLTALRLIPDSITPTGITVLPEDVRDVRANLPKTEATLSAVDEMLTVAQAAEHLGISDSMTRRRIRSGSIRATRTGRDWQIPRSALPTTPPAKRRPGVKVPASQ